MATAPEASTIGAPGLGSTETPAPQPESNFATNLGLALYLLFIISWFLQSARRYPVLGSIRFDLLLVIAISVLCALVPRRASNPNRSTWNPTRFVVILIVFAVVTVPFVEWPGSVLKSGIPEFIKAAVFCLFTATLVRTERDLRRFMVVFVGCQVFRVLEPLYLHVTDGYWGSYATMANWEYLARLAGAPADIINPNGLAFVTVTALVFFHFLAPHFKIGVLAYLGFIPLALYALGLTASRTGIIAFGIVIVSIWWKSRRKALIGAIIVTCIFGVGPLMSADLADRYLSIFSSNTKNATTASDRQAAVLEGLRVATRKPFFGHGLGTSGEANANFGSSEQPTHNLYVEVAQELGFIGLPIFLAFMFSIARDLGGVRRRCRETGATGLVPAVADSMQVFLAMNLMVSLASYGIFGYEWYLMAGVCAALGRLMPQQAAATQFNPVPASPMSGPTRLRPVSSVVRPAVKRPAMARSFQARVPRNTRG